MNENNLHTNHTSEMSSSTLRALIEEANAAEAKMIPEQELIDAGHYDLVQEDLIELLHLVRHSQMDLKARRILQQKLTVLLYRNYVE